MVGAAIVLYILGLRLLDEKDRTALSPRPGSQAKATAASQPAPAVADSAVATLSKALEGLPVAVRQGAGGVTLRIADDRQYVPGSIQPALPTRALLPRIAQALDKQPGAIIVVGHADAAPAGAHYASNADLSVARARVAARLMAAKLADPKRLSAEGRGDAEPLAPNDTEAGRGKNRRVEILLKTVP